MNLLPSNLGADKKKVIALAVLVVILPIAYYFGTSSDSPGPSAASPSKGPVVQPAPGMPALPTLKKEAPSPMPMQRNGKNASNQLTEDFHPSLKLKEGVDITGIDPTLHMDLLAKLHNLPMEGGARSVFKEGAPPPPPAPDPVKIKPGPMITDATAAPVKPEGPATPPPPPPPPPIPLKFYGYSTRGGVKRAFFMDGEEIQIAGENELIRKRYKVIKIGVNSAVVEDTTDKHQQTLPLEEELKG
jgi:hypothetical protein